MAAISTAKVTLDQYGKAYQLQQADKYRDRENNHFKLRIGLAKRLVEQYAAPRLAQKQPAETVVVDIGCSIGTFALEFSRLGYRSYGVDYDPYAVEIARQLCEEEGLRAEFVNVDLADWRLTNLPAIDVAICFDIFEHLHDDEMGSLLQAIRRELSDSGSLVFHTYPTEYDYIFFNSWYRTLPLLPFRWMSTERFSRVVRAYASVLDILLLLTRGTTVREHKKLHRHCNPTTKERLADVCERAGYDVVYLDTAQVYTRAKSAESIFLKHPISHPNLFGVAVPKWSGS